MKDFHDLYSLISSEEYLDPAYIDKVVKNVFNHRGTSLNKLPISFDADSTKILQSLWHGYQKDLPSSKAARQPPKLLQDRVPQAHQGVRNELILCVKAS